jgi:hypothetical protein
MVKQISDNEIYLLIEYIKSVLWRVAKRLSCIEYARCLKVNVSCITFTGPKERFLLSPNSSSPTTWWVPLTYTKQEKPDFKATHPQLWLENVQSTVVKGLPDNMSWVLFNVHETGLFLLFDVLLFSVLSVAEVA